MEHSKSVTMWKKWLKNTQQLQARHSPEKVSGSRLPNLKNENRHKDSSEPAKVSWACDIQQDVITGGVLIYIHIDILRYLFVFFFLPMDIFLHPFVFFLTNGYFSPARNSIHALDAQPQAHTSYPQPPELLCQEKLYYCLIYHFR